MRYGAPTARSLRKFKVNLSQSWNTSRTEDCCGYRDGAFRFRLPVIFPLFSFSVCLPAVSGVLSGSFPSARYGIGSGASPAGGHERVVFYIYLLFFFFFVGCLLCFAFLFSLFSFVSLLFRMRMICLSNPV